MVHEHTVQYREETQAVLHKVCAVGTVKMMTP